MKKISVLHVIRYLLTDMAAAFLIAAAVDVFAKQAEFAVGGVTGICLIMNRLTGLPIGMLTVALNIPLILLSWRMLGREFLAKSVISILDVALFTDYICIHIPAYTGDRLMAALFYGLLCGIGWGLIFLQRSSTGGTVFLMVVVNKLRPHLSMGTLTEVLDGIIILAGGLIFRDIDAVLYGLASTFVISIVMDRLMNGAVSGKMLMIITDHGQLISDQVAAGTGRGTTLIKATGGYSGREKDIVMCVCSRHQMLAAKKAVQAADDRAFMIVGDFTEVLGEGFESLL